MIFKRKQWVTVLPVENIYVTLCNNNNHPRKQHFKIEMDENKNPFSIMVHAPGDEILINVFINGIPIKDFEAKAPINYQMLCISRL